jgi:hypothetical protein
MDVTVGVFMRGSKGRCQSFLDVQQFSFGQNWIEGCTSMNYNKLKPTVSWERKEMPWTMSSSMCEDSTMSCVRMRMACGSVYN